jgi:hypothetical protein
LGHRQSKLFLVKSFPGGMNRELPAFRTGETIPESGIYRVVHREHRLPHEVTLLRNEIFPKCAKCHDDVSFELIRGVAFAEEQQGQQIRLYELPVLDDERSIAV